MKVRSAGVEACVYLRAYLDVKLEQGIPESEAIVMAVMEGAMAIYERERKPTAQIAAPSYRSEV